MHTVLPNTTGASGTKNRRSGPLSPTNSSWDARMRGTEGEIAGGDAVMADAVLVV